jgi:hypothetical protein
MAAVTATPWEAVVERVRVGTGLRLPDDVALPLVLALVCHHPPPAVPVTCTEVGAARHLLLAAVDDAHSPALAELVQRAGPALGPPTAAVTVTAATSVADLAAAASGDVGTAFGFTVLVVLGVDRATPATQAALAEVGPHCCRVAGRAVRF